MVTRAELYPEHGVPDSEIRKYLNRPEMEVAAPDSIPVRQVRVLE